MHPPGFWPSLVSDLADNALPSTTISGAAIASILPTTLALQAISSVASVTLSIVPPTSTMLAAMATANVTSDKGSNHGDENNGQCELLGPFALIVQAALGGLSLLSLVYKRWRERPQRPLRIWAFDVSKQVFGTVLLHLANLLMSMFSAGEISSATTKYHPNPCSFYLLNLAIDTTIGIPILIVILRLLTHGLLLTPLGKPPESIESGNYGDPPKAIWWFKQSIIYFIGLLGMKTCVFFIFELLPWIVQVGDWALRWTEGNEAVQVFFVMLLFPVIMNAIQYYIIDTFIKKQQPTDHEPIPSDDGQADGDGEEAHQGPLLDGRDSDDILDIDEEGEARKELLAKGAADRTNVKEYNPDKDSEISSTAVGSGSNSTSIDERAPLSPKPANR